MMEGQDLLWENQNMARLDRFKKPRNEQVGGDHYARHKIQPMDIMRDWYEPDECGAAMMQNVLKYLCRYRHKNGIEDLQKAADYLARLIEIEGENKP